jgi:hypothetical protein
VKLIVFIRVYAYELIKVTYMMFIKVKSNMESGLIKSKETTDEGKEKIWLNVIAIVRIWCNGHFRLRLRYKQLVMLLVLDILIKSCYPKYIVYIPYVITTYSTDNCVRVLSKIYLSFFLFFL